MYGNDTSTYIALRLENQKAAEELASKGIDIGKELAKIGALEEEVRKLKTEVDVPKDTPEIRLIKEQMVKGDQEVEAAKNAMFRVREEVLQSMLIRDPRYVDAHKNYWRLVDVKYVGKFNLGIPGPEVKTAEPETPT
jgi:hypothetical protein